MQLAKSAERGSPQIPLVWLSYMKHPFVIGGGFAHMRSYGVQEGQSVWTVIAPGFHPAV